jgi:F-type H+-transporting ATPase subunit a
VPYFAQSGFLLLEFFVGAIQAIVFGMLAMVFMSQATQGHGGHEEEHH